MKSQTGDALASAFSAHGFAPATSPAVVGGWVGDPRGGGLEWSDECYRLLGFEPGRGQPSIRAFLQQVHPQDRKRVLAAIARSLTEAGGHEIEYRMRLSDGNTGYFVNQGFTFCDESGRPVSIVGTTRRRGAQLRADAESRRQTDCIRVLMSHLPGGVAIFDAEARLRRWNSLFVDLLGLPREFAYAGARFDMLFLPLVMRGAFGAESSSEALPDLLRSLVDAQRLEMRRGASGVAVELRGRRLDEGGFALFCAEVAADPEEREKSLAHTVISNSPDGIVIVDAGHVIRSINPAFAAMTGYAPVEAVGRPIAALADDDFAGDMRRVIAGLEHRADWSGEVVLKKRDGDSVHMPAQVVQVTGSDGVRVAQYVWIFHDVSESRRVAEQVDHLAHHDPLTGLANRLMLRVRLEQALPEGRRRGWAVALMMLDLDRFKVINDTLGHSVGDELLREVASRLQHAVRETDMVARLGGDEFIVLLPDIRNAADVVTVARKVIGAFSRPVLVGSTELYTSPSIGVSMFPADGADADTLLRNADTAMYHAKAAGRNNYQFYAAEMNLAATQRLDLERKLRQALAHGELALVFQPQLRAEAGSDQWLPIGVEALARWHHPGDGTISPARFIPVAEETGLIVPLGEWVLRTACRQVKAWLDDGLPPIKVAVNVSARQLHRRDFLETVAGILAETDLPAEMLELEVTESVAMDNPEESIKLLQAIRRMGVSIAIDDFGTGYSSLAYLKRLPIDYLKIDRSFVADIEQDLNDRAIAFGTIALAHSLGLKVIAEGVETADQLDLLRGNRCDEIQGYFFSPPLPPEAAYDYLHQRIGFRLT